MLPDSTQSIESKNVREPYLKTITRKDTRTTSFLKKHGKKILFWLFCTVAAIIVGNMYNYITIDVFSPIQITPDEIILAQNNQKSSPIFYIQNNTDTAKNQIWVKLILISDILSLSNTKENKTIDLKYVPRIPRMGLTVPITNSTSTLTMADFILAPRAYNPETGQQSLYIYLDHLAPKESIQFQLVNTYPQKLNGKHYFEATILKKSIMPTEEFTGNDSLQIALSSIGEKLVIFGGDVITRIEN